MKASERVIRQLFAAADVEVGGTRPWDPQVHDQHFFDRVIREGTLGFGESYMDGDWDCDQLDGLTFRLVRTDIGSRLRKNIRLLSLTLAARWLNLQDRSRASRDVQAHYNIGNDLYQAMLDRRMTYTCGYWKNAESLDEAQEAKLDLVCRKIGLEAGMKVLDIGCGWGSFCRFAAERYGAEVVGITIAKEQIDIARDRCKGLPVEIRLEDYRDLDEQADRVVSLGMFEHVGYKNHRTFMRVVHRCLDDDGVFLLHTIGGTRSILHADPWVEKYIFPGAHTPSIAQIGKAIEGLFVMEDWHSFGYDYETTALAWWRNFDRHYEQLKAKYDERFYRMWRLYLVGGAGFARARDTGLWQIVMTRKGAVGGFAPARSS
jgi:cyclopropane-fatty-acyl-phospholipid synthase